MPNLDSVQERAQHTWQGLAVIARKPLPKLTSTALDGFKLPVLSESRNRKLTYRPHFSLPPCFLASCFLASSPPPLTCACPLA